MSWIRLIIKSELSEVALLIQTIGAACEYFGISEQYLHRVKIAAAEAVTNVIRHAYQLSSGKDVLVTLAYDQIRLQMDVEDYGTMMRPLQIDLLKNGSSVLDVEDSSLDQLPETGLGLEIIHRSVDQINYFHSEGANRLCMTFLISAESVANIAQIG